MKLFKKIVVACAVVLAITSCSVMQKPAASSATTSGSSTGAAISALYNVLKATGGIDLSSIVNLINLSKILTGANALTNATGAFTTDFATGLINGSSELVNANNVSKVMNGLQALNKIDTSALLGAAAAGKSLAGSAAQDAGTKAAVNAITGLLKSLE